MAMNIKRVIKAHGMQARDVAAAMGITPVTLSSHINGNPSVEILERIAQAIGCGVADFFMEDDEWENTATIVCPHCGETINLTAR